MAKKKFPKPPEAVWERAGEPKIAATPPDAVISKTERILKSGAKVEVARLFNGDWGLGFIRVDGAIEIRSRFALSTEALESVITQYQEIKGKPVSTEMEFVVTEVPKAKSKSQMKRIAAQKRR